MLSTEGLGFRDVKKLSRLQTHKYFSNIFRYLYFTPVHFNKNICTLHSGAFSKQANYCCLNAFEEIFSIPGNMVSLTNVTIVIQTG